MPILKKKFESLYLDFEEEEELLQFHQFCEFVGEKLRKTEEILNEKGPKKKMQELTEIINFYSSL